LGLSRNRMGQLQPEYWKYALLRKNYNDFNTKI